MEAQYAIRKMETRDCARVAYIDAQCINNPWSQESFEDLFRYLENYYLVAECNQQIVGFVGLIQFVDDGDITHIAVLPQYRKIGIAYALMQEIFTIAKQHMLKAIHLEVRLSNKAAINLYEKLGFELQLVRPNYYTNPPEDAQVMVKYL